MQPTNMPNSSSSQNQNNRNVRPLSEFIGTPEAARLAERYGDYFEDMPLPQLSALEASISVAVDASYQYEGYEVDAANIAHYLRGKGFDPEFVASIEQLDREVDRADCLALITFCAAILAGHEFSD
jgi:hypothetical protein